MFVVYEKITAATFKVMGINKKLKHWGVSWPLDLNLHRLYNSGHHPPWSGEELTGCAGFCSCPAMKPLVQRSDWPIDITTYLELDSGVFSTGLWQSLHTCLQDEGWWPLGYWLPIPTSLSSIPTYTSTRDGVSPPLFSPYTQRFIPHTVFICLPYAANMAESLWKWLYMVL
jgi:hypothetical protein